MKKEISKELIGHIAKLGMIKIATEEMPAYQSHFEKILTYVDELKNVNTDGVEPLANPMRDCLELFKNHSDRRDDLVKPSLPVELVLKNAPDQMLNQFKVEAVIGEVE